MIGIRSVPSVSMTAVATLAGILLPSVLTAANEASAPCLGLGSIQIMDAPGDVVAFDIGGDYAATIDSNGLTVWTYSGDGFPVRRGSWLAGRGFPGYFKGRRSLRVDPRGWAYVGGWETGFFLVDLRDPDRPEIVFESMTEGDRHLDRGDRHLENVHNPNPLGNVLFLQSEALDGHVFLDVENPLNPRLIPSRLPRDYWYLGFIGHHLVKGPAGPGRGDSMVIWNFEDQGDPQPIATIPDLWGFMPGVMWAGDRLAIMATGIGGAALPFGVLDLSDPVNPSYVQFSPLDEPLFDWYTIEGAAVDGSTAYVIATLGTLMVPGFRILGCSEYVPGTELPIY